MGVSINEGTPKWMVYRGKKEDLVENFYGKHGS